MKYRVRIKVSYYDAWFSFDSAEDATTFAVTALTHQETCEDTKKTARYIIEVVDNTAEAAESKEDE